MELEETAAAKGCSVDPRSIPPHAINHDLRGLGRTRTMCLRIVGLFSESNESPMQMLVCWRQRELCLCFIGIQAQLPDRSFRERDALMPWFGSGSV